MGGLIDARVARLTDREFSAMVEAGVFGDRRVFLWGGRICEKLAKTNAHAFVGARISQAVRPLLPEDWDTCARSSSTAGRGSSTGSLPTHRSRAAGSETTSS